LRFLLSIARTFTALLVLTTAIPALAALLGFAIPQFDLFNHLQVLLFFGTMTGLVLALLFRVQRIGKVLASLGFVASALIFMPEYLSSLEGRPAPTGAATVRVMTHNIFGLNIDMARVASVIQKENPDIIAFQEYFPEQANALHALLTSSYPYSVHCAGGKRANLALYAKLPFQLEMAPADCPSNAYGLQRTAHIIARFTEPNGSQFSVMTTHMDWPFPIERQRTEFEAAEANANAVKGPLVVVGDFNSTPWSYAMKSFESVTGLHRETRNLITYPKLFTLGELVRTQPFLALDQVFERGLSVTELHRGPETGSDHLPVIFTFEVPAPAAG
jgi:endonuclease/exonuclease/phosphatase (EEP) superfamily protein YafD